ncbi:MAG: hypothetical protein COC00_011430 [Rhizobiales bacterium]|nr:hypothetical protein [Hyphomicrobiales bacterium]
MHHFARILAFTIFSIISTASFAGVRIGTPVTTFSNNNETVASIGLRLEFGDVVKPSVVVTVRRTETNKNNDVSGALADIAIPLNTDGSFKPTFRIMGIFGDTNAQGTAGAGFDFAKKLPILSLGVRGRNVDGGVNISADGISPFIAGSTDGGPAKRKEKTIITFIPYR